MSDLISREALKKHKFTVQICNGVEIEDVEVVPVASIDNATTVEERRQGEFEKSELYSCGNALYYRHSIVERMTTKYNVGDTVLIKGIVETIYIETTDNEPIYHVRIKGAGTHEAYGIRVNEGIMEERPQGEWIEGENGNIKCNKCGCEIRYSYLIGNKPDFPKFCCDCGSKMKGGAERLTEHIVMTRMNI